MNAEQDRQHQWKQHTRRLGGAMPTHTPGPWETMRDAVPEGFVQVTVYAEGSGARVATVFEAEANARLVAAAPDLLEAAKKVAIHVRLGDLHPKDMQNLRAAIARAEGEEP